MISAAMHGALLATFAAVSGSASFEAGTGDDLMKVEQGIALDSILKLGEAEETFETVEVPPVQQAVDAPPPVEEAKPEELVGVITSEAAPPEDAVAVRDEPPPPIEEPRPEEQRVEEQLQQIAMIALKSSADEHKGGDADAIKAFKGAIYAKISRNAKAPARLKTGTVTLAFTISADGQLLSREVLQSSGSKLLDEAAIATLDRASPFPPFPAGIDEPEMQLTIPFNFR